MDLTRENYYRILIKEFGEGDDLYNYLSSTWDAVEKLPKRQRQEFWESEFANALIRNRLGIRKKLSNERGEAVYRSKEYQADILNIRKKLDIPNNLSEQYTGILYGGSFDIDNPDEKVYFHLKTEELDKLLDEEIKSILTKYGLPPYFDNWVKDQVLNLREPHDYSIYNLNWLCFISNEAEWENIPSYNLTTGEKSFLKELVRERLSIGHGRPSNIVAEKYARFLKLISKSKNKNRGIKNLNEVLETFSGKSYREIATAIPNPKSKHIIDEIDRLEKKKFRTIKRYPFLKAKK